MSGYTIAAIPTMYRGRQYRSRLEARWAAFFDLLRWQHEYEPFDLGSWSPDFLFPIPDSKTGMIGVLVEIKPITAFDEPTADRITQALAASEFRDKAIVSLFGVAPWIEGGQCCISWTFSRKTGWSKTALLWEVEKDRPEFRAFAWPAGEAPPKAPPAMDYPEHTMRLWAEASNAAQWLGRRAQS